MRDAEQRLSDLMAEYTHDPLSWVMASFDWGVGELSGELVREGPDEWQKKELIRIRDHLSDGGTVHEVLRIAISAGNGPGKSALICWLLLWAMSTHPDTKGVVTANTETQLRTKTWAEMAKWHRLFIARHWFTLTATALYSTDPDHEKTWRIDAVPWSEKNVEAFAGLHNQGRRLIIIFDEGSGIPDIIWGTTEGALTDKDTEIIWIVGGNPTKNTGRFRECFRALKHRWLTTMVDTRTARLTNKQQIKEWIEDNGEDSDYVRVHVKGEFPRVSTLQFISTEAVTEARKREVAVHLFEPLIIGVDVARFGTNESVILIRKGRDARTHKPMRFRGLDTTSLAIKVAEIYQNLKADGLFVDGGGVGGGVVDYLRNVSKVPVVEVQFGAKPDRDADGEHYADKSAEMWGFMRKWLKGGAIPDEQALEGQLCGREYSMVIRDGKDCIKLEPKKDMEARGLESPDWADALALTFAAPVMANRNAGHLLAGQMAAANNGEYDPLHQPMQGDYDPHHVMGG